MPSEVLPRALDVLAVQFIPWRLRYKTSNETIEYQAERQGEWLYTPIESDNDICPLADRNSNQN